MTIKTKNCLELMTASNLFGRGLGEKKLHLIIDKFPYICNNQKKALELEIDDLININGMGNITASLFISNLQEFYKFYNLLNIINDVKEDVKEDIKEIKNNKYMNNIYVFSGIRDKDLEKIIVANGGKIAAIVSKKTTALIVKNYDEETVKVKTAKSFNIPIIEYNEFIK